VRRKLTRLTTLVCRHELEIGPRGAGNAEGLAEAGLARPEL